MKYYYISKESENVFLKLRKDMREKFQKLGKIFEGGGNNIVLENPQFLAERAIVMDSYEKKMNNLSSYDAFIIIEDMEEYKNFDGISVIIGSKIKLKFDDEDEEECWIRGTNEVDAKKSIMSCESPLSQSLLGKKVGDEFDFRGSKVKILAVSI